MTEWQQYCNAYRFLLEAERVETEDVFEHCVGILHGHVWRGY